MTEIIAHSVEFIEKKKCTTIGSEPIGGNLEEFGPAVPFDEEIPFLIGDNMIIYEVRLQFKQNYNQWIQYTK